MGRALRRAAPVVAAVALGTAFLTAVLVFQDSMWATAEHDLDEALGDHSFVIQPACRSGSPLTDEVARQLEELPGVEAVTPAAHGIAFVRHGQRTKATMFNSLEWLPPSADLAEGALPGSGEVLMSVAAARDHGAGVGAEVEVLETPFEDSGVTVTVSGLFEPAGIVLPGDEQSMYATTATVGEMRGSAPGEFSELLVTGGSADDIGGKVNSLETVSQAGGARVRTVDAFVSAQVREALRGDQYLRLGVMAIVAAAFIVLALVIRSAFGVQVEREARTYALERCLGATRGQVIREVLVGAGLVGLPAAVVGAALGAGLVAGLCAVGAVPLVFSAGPIHLATAVVAGVAVCVVGALGPAFQASRNSPLGAYQASVGGRSPAKTSRRIAPWVQLAVFAGAVAVLAGSAVIGALTLAIPLAVVVAVLGVALAGRASVLVAGLLSKLETVRRRTVLAEACERVVANPGRSASIAGLAYAAVAFIALVGVGSSSGMASVRQAD
jgi:putative ABC transport system permease protein